jgi:hypothetical protein
VSAVDNSSLLISRTAHNCEVAVVTAGVAVNVPAAHEVESDGTKGGLFEEMERVLDQFPV